MSQNIKARTVQGVMWVGVIQLLRSGIQFVVTIILARLLFPKDFGTIGMAVIFINLIAKLNSLGFSAALVQRKDLTEDHLSTAFWSNVMVGALLYGVVAGSSPFVAAFFNNPQVQPIMMVISLSLIISPVGMIHSTLLTRELNFGRNGLFQIGGTFIEGAISIWMALNGFGVWSLVWGEFISSVITAISKWFIVDWRPSFRFRAACFKDLFSFGIYNTGLNLINSGALNVDYLFVGKIMGAGPLGVYTMAFNLANMSCKKITMLVGKVAFPAFSRIQDDDTMMRRMYLKSVSYVSLITFPATAGLFAVAPDLIQVVYTSKWGAALLPLQILCVVGLLKSVEVSVFAVYQAKGRADLDFKFQCVYLAVLALGVWLGLRKGIVGVATAVAIVEIIFTIMRQYVINRLIGLRFSSFWASLAPAVLGTVVMITALEAYIYLLRVVAPEHEAFRLFSSIPIGATIYLATLWIYRRAIIDEIIGLAREQNILNGRSWREKWQRPMMQPKIEMEEKVSWRKGVKKSYRKVLIRDDDVSFFTRPELLDQLYGPLLAIGLPVNLGVIPCIATDACMNQDGRKPNQFMKTGLKYEPHIPPSERGKSGNRPITANRGLTEYIRSQPYEVVQHGYSHSWNGEGEFSSKDPGVVLRHMSEGRELLKDTFKEYPAFFCPPWDHIPISALAEIRQMGFSGISLRQVKPLLKPRHWPAFIWRRANGLGQQTFSWNGMLLVGHPGYLLNMFREPNDLLAKIRIRLERAPITVLVNHHWEYNFDWKDRMHEARMAFWREVVKIILETRGVEVIRFSDLL